ncbi:TIGR03943 family putative permease subunit [Kribbella catacumbae]|uniref:TIGR03943 family putative permease subunit n=1 Tax=Kribbella catacumbae TaxID=460086 RepID=UPI000371E313|nr:TIGR03943 family protein [Kribbella catacumbae]
MRRNVAGLVVVFVGAAVMQLAISNTYLRYVKPGMRWMLLAAGAILIVLAVADVLADTRKKPGEHQADDGHGHGHLLPRAAWLLVIPIFALLVVDPPALGADAAQRQSPVAAKPAVPKGNSFLGESTAGAAPVPLAVRDYAVWAVWEKESMKGRNFQLTGFVTPGKNGTWYVSRIGLTCCVADGTAFMVEARGQTAPPKNQWVTVTGEWAEPTKRADGDVAALTVTGVQNVTPPANQYE